MKRKSINRGLSICAVLILVILTSGCATTLRMYKGKQRPKDQIAIIKESIEFYVHFGMEVRLKDVDGIPCEERKLGTFYNSVEVLPGWHRISTTVTRSTATGFWDSDNYNFCFYAMPGHEYRIESDFWKTKNALVTIVDSRSREIVASQKRAYQPCHGSSGYWYKPNVNTEQLKRDYGDCEAKCPAERNCMGKKGYTWAKF